MTIEDKKVKDGRDSRIKDNRLEDKDNWMRGEGRGR